MINGNDFFGKNCWHIIQSNFFSYLNTSIDMYSPGVQFNEIILEKINLDKSTCSDCYMYTIIWEISVKTVHVITCIIEFSWLSQFGFSFRRR